MSKVLRRRKSKEETSSSPSLSLRNYQQKAANSTPSHMNIMNSKGKESSTSSNQIQKVLKQLKRLEIEYNKFQSKSNGITKTNILRTSLLPFLRDPACEFKHLMTDESIYLSLTSISTNTLIKWWRSLLTCVSSYQSGTSIKPPIVTKDRNAYLEGISRIIARFEWNLVDQETKSKFEQLLTQTLEFAIDKVQTMKILPLAISAFVGKVFACSFFHLPKVSEALLFLLNVKQKSYELAVETFKDIESISSENLQNLYKLFPPAVSHLSKFKGFPGLAKSQKFYINSIAPPAHPVKGINNPNESWVRRWCGSDSDIFNSFFRHYIKFACDFLSINGKIENSLVNYQTNLANAPGFIFIMAHILQIFEISINRISQNNPNFSGLNVFFKDQLIANKKDLPASNINDIYFNSIVKILKSCREVKFTDRIVSRALIEYVDNILISIAKRTSVYDYNRNGLIINIVYELAIHVDNDINWEFWLSSCYLMITKTDHIQILLKSIAFLFNSWDLIPMSLPMTKHKLNTNSSAYSWIVNLDESYKWNFAHWLLSFPVWNQLFSHWEPIVRSYYIRLIIWRLLGMNDPYSANRIAMENLLKNNLELSYDFVIRKMEVNKLKVNLSADSPLLNRNFGIIRNNKQDEFDDTTGKEELRKTHAYEIFDEAVYSCSSLPKLQSNPDYDSDDSDKSVAFSPSSNSSINTKNTLVNSLGKIFRKLSTEDKKERNSNGLFSSVIDSPNAPPIGSLSAVHKNGSSGKIAYLKDKYDDSDSGSSSPSMISLTTQSFTDFSTTSSIESESSSSTSSINLSQLLQPPELLTRPPEIIRPIFRFELICEGNFDTSSFFNRGKVSNEHQKPTYPRLPNTSNLFDALFNDSEIIVTDEISTIIRNYDVSDDEELEFKPQISNNPLYPENKRQNWINVAKSINEWNNIVHEFESFMKAKVEEFKSKSSDNYEVYFKKVIPFLSVDSSNELKLLNAG